MHSFFSFSAVWILILSLKSVLGLQNIIYSNKYILPRRISMTTPDENLNHKRRRTSTVELKNSGIGNRNVVQFHDYGPHDATESAYIQATLHADELPGLLVCHHLIQLLDKAQAKGDILKKITVVPYANPIGLSQHMLGYFVGRFSLSTGVNFNRDFLNITENVYNRIIKATAVDSSPEDVLSSHDEKHNVRVVRRAILAELDLLQSQVHRCEKEEAALKRVLYAKAAVADIVLDLHCDCDAVMHMYTHDRLWPKMADLASEIGAHCSLLAPYSGGDPFDEACSCLWATLQDKLTSSHPLPMACEAVTIELRGESDVYDDLAEGDAHALFRFFVGRGFLSPQALSLLGTRDSSCGAGVVPKAVPLSGVDMIEASACGVLAWRVKAGDVVTDGQLLGEIVNIEDPDAARIPIVTRTAGIVFGVRRHKLARPGEICIKVAGDFPLPWRTGHLLTSR